MHRDMTVVKHSCYSDIKYSMPNFRVRDTASCVCLVFCCRKLKVSFCSDSCGTVIQHFNITYTSTQMSHCCMCHPTALTYYHALTQRHLQHQLFVSMSYEGLEIV